MTVSDNEPFGFTVSVQAENTHGPTEDVIVDRWYVELPHQCDEWVVATSYDKQAAVDQLSRFIREATSALEDLQQTEPCPHQWESAGGGENHVSNAGTGTLRRCARCGQGVWTTIDRTTASPWFAAQYYHR